MTASAGRDTLPAVPDERGPTRPRRFARSCSLRAPSNLRARSG